MGWYFVLFEGEFLFVLDFFGCCLLGCCFLFLPRNYREVSSTEILEFLPKSFSCHRIQHSQPKVTSHRSTVNMTPRKCLMRVSLCTSAENTFCWSDFSAQLSYSATCKWYQQRVT